MKFRIENKNMNFNEDIQNRTKKFSIKIIKFYSNLNKIEEIRIIGRQLLRSCTSVAANFRASCRARSPKEYFAKLSICVEEADETLFWLELITEADLVKKENTIELIKEATEILKILASTRKRAKLKL